MSEQTSNLADDALEIGTDVPGEGDTADDSGAVRQAQDAQPTDDAVDLSTLTEAQIKALSPEVQKFVRNVQADYTRKTQGVAAERRALEGRAAYASLAEEVQQRLDEEGPEAAASFLREAADELAVDKRSARQDSATSGPDILQQVAQGAMEILQSSDAAPNEQALARGMLTLLQVNAGLAEEVRSTKQEAQSGLRQFANQEIERTITTLHNGEYKALEADVSKFAETVLQTARREGLTNLTAAAKLAYADKQIEQARGQAQKRAGLKALLPDGDTTGGQGPSTQGDPKTVEEAFARAKARQSARR